MKVFGKNSGSQSKEVQRELALRTEKALARSWQLKQKARDVEVRPAQLLFFEVNQLTEAERATIWESVPWRTPIVTASHDDDAVNETKRTADSRPHSPGEKNASSSCAIVGIRALRSRNRLNASHDVSEMRMHAWHAAALMVA